MICFDEKSFCAGGTDLTWPATAVRSFPIPSCLGPGVLWMWLVETKPTKQVLSSPSSFKKSFEI